jgi:hypothetical protein
MGQEVAFTALTSLVSLFGICYLLFWRYRSLRVDKFRQDMFELRDELFDYASAGNVEFDERAYGLLRSTINGYIRHAHRMTLWHVVFLGLLIRRQDVKLAETFINRWEKATTALPDEVKERLEAFKWRMEKLVVKHFFTAAPEFFIILVPLALIALVALFIVVCVEMASSRRVSAAVWNTLRSGLMLNKVDDAAMLHGEQVA